MILAFHLEEPSSILGASGFSHELRRLIERFYVSLVLIKQTPLIDERGWRLTRMLQVRVGGMKRRVSTVSVLFARCARCQCTGFVHFAENHSGFL